MVILAKKEKVSVEPVHESLIEKNPKNDFIHEDLIMWNP